jgi:hypothetical protein
MRYSYDRRASAFKDSPVALFWEKMAPKCHTRPKEEQHSEGKIEATWNDGPGIAPQVTIRLHNGHPQAQVDGQWFADPLKAAKAFNDWLSVLHDEASGDEIEDEEDEEDEEEEDD